MKHTVSLLLCGLLLLCLSGCVKEEKIASWQNEPNLLAVLADEEEISREIVAHLYEKMHEFEAASLNMGLSWQSPQEKNREGRLQALAGSIAQGAKIVLCVGSEYDTVVHEAQERHPEIMFLLLDGEARAEHSQLYESLPNTHCIRFQQSEAGFLAGYAAVTEGARKLGFCSGVSNEDMIRYAYGFLQGADAAAAALGLVTGDVLLRFWYAGEEDLAEGLRRQMEEWQEVEGLDLVFICEGKGLAIAEESIQTAETLGVDVILGESLYTTDSTALLCTVEKDYGRAAEEALLRLAGNGGVWDPGQAGRTATLGAGEQLSLKGRGQEWPFTQLGQAEYNALVEQMRRGEIDLEKSGNSELLPAFSICTVTE